MIVIGSRGSQLALWQANHIQARLQALGAETRIEIIKTSGDKIQDVPLAKVGGKGLFTKEIEEALLDRSIDLAVHSLKDLPTEVPNGLTIAAVPEREDPRDAIVGKRLDELSAGHTVGTSSLRRAAQLQVLVGPGFQPAAGLPPGEPRRLESRRQAESLAPPEQSGRLSIKMLRGNVDTRLRKLDEGEYDAIVLAAAGLRRLGLEQRIADLIPVEIMCPAVGQGALAIETRDDGGPAHGLAQKLNHQETRTAVTAERALLKTLEGGCQVPVGAHAILSDGSIHLRAIVASPDGERAIRGELKGTDPAAVGAELGRQLLEQGAREILEAVYSA